MVAGHGQNFWTQFPIQRYGQGIKDNDYNIFSALTLVELRGFEPLISSGAGTRALDGASASDSSGSLPKAPVG
jgi:hypothetical protein